MNVKRKVANKKWIICLNDVKNQIDNKEVTNLNNIIRKHNTGTGLATMLITGGIVYKNNLGVYKWNKDVAVNNKLIELYRSFQKIDREINRKNKINNNQPKIQFNMPQTPLPPKPKTRIRKKIIDQSVNTPTQQNELGVIRRFLKWLW